MNNTSLRVVFIAAEAAPFAKTGGLADVAGSLPNALRQLNVDVRVVMPGYRQVFEHSLRDEPALVQPEYMAGFSAV